MRGGFPPERAMASMRVRNRAFVCKRQRAKQQKRRRHVQRRRQWRGFDDGALALLISKIKPVVEANLFARANARIKVRQICAAAQRDVLAIVHLAAIGQRVGSGASAQVGTFFQQTNPQTGFSQRDGGRQTRQPAADY